MSKGIGHRMFNWLACLLAARLAQVPPESVPEATYSHVVRLTSRNFDRFFPEILAAFPT